MAQKRRKILVGITGASGMIFVRPFLRLISEKKAEVELHGVISDSGKKVLALEESLKPENLTEIERWFESDDFAAPPSSGSSGYDCMVILPCTMGTLGAIASGLSQNLIHRAADVMLKERKKLILCVRETPYNRTHLENMLKAHDAGAMVSPPMPGFYLKPKNLEEAVLTYCWRLADHIGVNVNTRKRWEG